MTYNVVITPNQNPFSDGNITQSNAGSSSVTAEGYLQQTTADTSNLITLAGSADKNQSVTGTIQSTINGVGDFFSFDAAIQLYLLYSDANNCVRLEYSHGGTDNNNFSVYTRIAGTEAEFTLESGLSDTFLADGDLIKFDVAWSGADATFTVSRNGEMLGSPLVRTSFALTSGKPGVMLQKNGSNRNTMYSSLTFTGDASSIISAGTPSGTTTDRTPTVGFTTDTAGGTGYVVISQASMSSIAADQIAAGTDDNDDALPNSQVFSAAISSTAFSANQASAANLAAGTWHAYGVQDADDAGTYSNILSWTFAIPANPGVRVEEIYQPNADALVADASADCAVYDVIGGTKKYQGTISISGGSFEIDSNSVGNIGDHVFLVARWDVIAGESTEERVFGATLPVIDLDA